MTCDNLRVDNVRVDKSVDNLWIIMESQKGQISPLSKRVSFSKRRCLRRLTRKDAANYGVLWYKRRKLRRLQSKFAVIFGVF